jgi:hypothetical protein
VSGLAAKLNAEFDAWFEKVKAISKEPIEPNEGWAELWFDGHAPLALQLQVATSSESIGHHDSGPDDWWRVS